ncbi:heterokaryon incompatibility protein-domain-containing protein [Podospora appendiculata]|uniref:Heterokaryon incompatibility protein-domain-containing protein n=1 Tax=Podospora appendiculata TaxID=314037 RepID=A0AAE1C8U9_9PEZI|nr:heterokaryon incompatibility protein-domain-containing protein [Podospora appendiculata]
MTSWHETSCNRPDVYLVDGTPFCMSCGSLATVDDIDYSQAPSGLPVPSATRAHLGLSWPSSVKYANTCIGTNGEDITNQVAETVAGLGSFSGDHMNISPPDSPVLIEAGPGRLESEVPVHEPHAHDRTRADPSHGLIGTNQIRLLRLSKGQASEPLHGMLEVYHLKYFPDYEALSYTWADESGDANRTKKIYLGNDWSIFPITSSCEAALRCLRLPNKGRTIWVDAICINQTSVDERSHQVQLMPVIYATAQRVLVYTGHSNPERDIRADHQQTSRPSITSDYRHSRWDQEWEQEWKQMDGRLKTPYFFRSLIIQEIAVARTALVSNGTTWHVWPIYDKSKEVTRFLPWIKHFDSPKYKTSIDLVQLVIDTWSSRASDPRDKIFALLGVISGAAVDGLVADYSLSTEHIYTGFAAFALLKQGMTDLFKYAGGNVKSHNLPSWVPDFELLSHDWSIMSQLEQFHSTSTQRNLLDDFGISQMWTEQISRPRIIPVANSEQDPFAGATVHGPTGALCLAGIKIAELAHGFSRSITKDGFAVFEGPLFITAMSNAEEQDSVFFLQGFDSLVILRRHHPSRDDIFTFMGMCYVRFQTGMAMKYPPEPFSAPFSGPLQNWLQSTQDWSALLPSRLANSINLSVDGLHSQGIATLEMEFKSIEKSNLALSGWRAGLCESLGREAERIWTVIIQERCGDILFSPSARRFDIMQSAIPVLGDLKRALKSRSTMCESIISLLDMLEEGKRIGALGSNQVDEANKRIAELEQLSSRFLRDKDLSGWNWPESGPELGDVIKAELEELCFGSGTRDESTPLRRAIVEYNPIESCPRWYLYQQHDIGASVWYELCHKQASNAMTYLQDAILEGRNAWETESLARVREANLEEARSWKQVFETAVSEIDVVMLAVNVLIEQRTRRVALTEGGWKPIVII